MIFVGLGWLATAAYLLGHIYLATRHEYDPNIYYGLNLTGAIGFIISSGVILSWQSVVINVFWAYISVAALWSRLSTPRFSMSRWVMIAPVFAAVVISTIFAFYNVSFASNALGWAGTVLYIAGYFLFANATIQKWQFLFYNTIAALILMPIYHLDGNWPAFGLSLIWSIISLVGLWSVRSTIIIKR